MMNLAPEINLHYSLEFEQQRVQNTFEKIAWYREHGYNPAFPGNKRIPDIDESQGVSGLLALIEVEYDPAFYDTAANGFKEKWQWFANHWAESPIKDTALAFSGTYEVYFTTYGVGGSYDTPNTVIMNVRRGDPDKLVSVLFHEMIHLCLEPLIQKYSIPHWYKERMVDLYYKRIFPEKAFEQNLPKEVLAVDPIFNSYFSQPENLVVELAKYLSNISDNTTT